MALSATKDFTFHSMTIQDSYIAYFYYTTLDLVHPICILNYYYSSTDMA